jgi:ankyrin repeat protein
MEQNMKVPSGKTRIRIIVLAIAAVVVTVTCVTFYHEIKHERLNAALIRAIKAENLDRAIALISQGADGSANESNMHHGTLGQAIQQLLHAFSRKPNGERVESEGGSSALLFYYETVKPEFTDKMEIIGPPSRLPEALLKSGACVSSRDKNGTSVLDYACMYHHHLVVRKLMDMGIDANEARVSNARLTPLMLADLQDSRTLLDHGARVDDTGYKGRTALFWADGGKSDLLLERGANVDFADVDGYTPLIHACSEGMYNTALKMLALHASVNHRSKRGQTAILCSAYKCKLETVLDLVHRGANPHDKSANGATFLMGAAANPDVRVFNWAMKLGIDVNARTSSGTTALIKAAGFGRLEAVKALVAAGANIHDSWRGTTCLALAAGNPDARVCEWLIRQGLDVNRAGRNGVTALSIAAVGSSVDTVKVLVRAGANINATSSDGQTPLIASVSNEDPRVLAWLLTQAVDVNHQDNDGKTALSIAEANRILRVQDKGNHETEDRMVALLKSHGAR